MLQDSEKDFKQDMLADLNSSIETVQSNISLNQNRKFLIKPREGMESNIIDLRRNNQKLIKKVLQSLKSSKKHDALKDSPEIKTLLREQKMTKYFLNMKHVNDNYLKTDEEKRQLQKIEALFHNFDTDGSGGLDAQEFVELYNQNDVPVDEGMIESLYGDDINFTLERFIAITKDKEGLQRYF